MYVTMYACNCNLFLKNLIKIFYKVLNQLKLKDFKINNFQNCALNVKKNEKMILHQHLLEIWQFLLFKLYPVSTM